MLRSGPCCSLALGIALVISGCSGRGSDANPADAARIVLSVNATSVEPSATAAIPALDYAQYGLEKFGAVYRLTTPANVPFAFDLMTWQGNASGTAMLSIAHVGDGGTTPVPDLRTLAQAGIAPSGTGMMGGGGWLSVTGDGFARLSLQGLITRDQVLAVSSDTGASLVHIAIGERSAINQIEHQQPAHPFVASRDGIYSSEAWDFGMPTVAVSGDRTTIVAYEGDRELGMLPRRYEVRMQHDRTTGVVTGGGSVEASADSGNWRDHEIAALYNVLASLRSEPAGVRIRLSYDRGAAFQQDVLLDSPAGFGQTRLVQAAMALDYSLAVVYWQADASANGLSLMLCEGRPTAFDIHGSPTWFGFDPPQVVRTMPANASPLLSGVAWSSGGDLVIGYAASWWGGAAGGGWASTTEFRCAVRLFGGPLADQRVDLEQLVGYDPSVAVLGEGATMRIFYAYETRQGVRLATSSDGGATFAIEPEFGFAGSHNPSVFARQVGAETRIDVLYLTGGSMGRELHHARWPNYGVSQREDFRLTASRLEPTPPSPGRVAASGWTGPYDYGLRTTQINWLGYDAVLDGDQIVVVYDEVTQDAAFTCLGVFAMRIAFEGGPILGPTTSGFQHSAPPPLAPGMTEPMPPVDPVHSHQLVIVRID